MKQLSSTTLILLFIVCFSRLSFSQVAIGTGATAPNPDTNAVLLLEGNGSQGIIIPKVSSLGTFGKPGMIVYNTTTGSVHYFNTAWVQVGSGTGGTQGIQIVGNKVLIGTGAGFSTEFSIANTAPTIQGQILMWDTTLNSGAGGWTSSANTAPSTIGQVLKWNGSRWEPGTDNTGTVATLSGDVSGATTSTTISTTAGNSIATALNNGATTSRILESRITPSGTNNQVLTTVGGVTQWANPTGGALPSLSANQLLSNNGANTAITVAGDVGLSVTGTTGTFTIANNAITDVKVAAGISGSKINPAFGTQNITTTTGSASIGGGLNVGLANGFTINNAGNITKINGANTSFPATNAAGILTNDGTGTLTWAVAGGTGTVTSVTAGTGLTGGAITTSGTLSVDVGTTANKIVQLDATGKLPAVDGSQLTGLAGGGDITGVTAGTGLTGGAASGNATLNVDVGTTANKIVQLDATGKLPAVDGSQLTGLAGGGDITGVTAGTGLTGGAASGNATLNVDVGTTANKIVQLDATGKLPVIDGSQLTNLPAGAESDPTVKAINGLVKSNGAIISAATAGTDYLTPTGSAAGLTGITAAQIPNLDAAKITTGTLPVAIGGTGATTLSGLIVGNGASPFTAVTIGSNGQILTVSGGNPTWQNAPTPSGSAGGDLLGSTYPNPVIAAGAINSTKLAANAVATSNIANLAVTDAKINDVAPGKITQAAATSGQVLKWNGSAWAPAADAVGGGGAPTLNPGQIIVGDGTTNSGATVSLDAILNSTNGNITVQGLQGRPISAAVPANNSVYQFNGTQWAPVVLSGGGTVSSIATGAGLTGGPITGTGTISITPGGVTSTELAVGAVGNANIAANTVNSSQIIDGTIADADISPTAAIAVTKLATGTNGQVLTVNAGVPSWQTSAALVNPMTTLGDIISGGVAGTPTRLGAGSNGQVLTVTAGAPSWQNAPPPTGLAGGDLSGSYPNPTIGATAATGNNIITSINSAATLINGARVSTSFGAQNISTTGTLSSGVATVTGLTVSGTTTTLNTVPYTWPAVQGGAGTVLTNNGSGIVTWGAAGLSNPLTTNGDIIYGVGSTPTRLAAGTGFLKGGAVPSYAAVNLASADVSGILPIANGGTGAITAPTALTNLGGLSNTLTNGNILVGSVGNVATGVAMSGDANITNAGLVTIQPGAISGGTGGKILDATITDADINGGAAIAGTKVAPNFGVQNVVTTGTLTTGTAGAFAVNAAGNITKINNVTTSFPAANASGVLTNDGTGTLTWAPGGSGWALGGNTGTIDGAIGTGTNYIGTKDNVPLNFIVNNTRSGRIDPTVFSTFFGFSSGQNNSGISNTGMGNFALSQNTSGSGNTGVGASSLSGTTIGNDNTAVGNGALFFNSTGSGNSAFGQAALSNSSTASGNTAMGNESLRFTSTGLNNTALGGSSGVTNTTGSNNSFLGSDADATVNNLTNATAIGYNAKVGASNTIQLGNAAVTTVNVGTGTTAKLVAGQLQITGGTLGAGRVLTSDASGNATWQAGGGGGWGLTGNAGTVDGTNFIGTTDNIPLNFRMNNLKAGRIDNVNASTFFGSLAGNLNTGNQNAAFGSQAMEKNVGGATNAAFGQLALNNNTTGGFNVAVGAISMSNNTTGGNNIAVGVQANNNNTTGSGNTSVGYNANYSNVGSTFNTAVGIDALFNNTGANNTAMGRQALFNNTSGSGNTGLGYQAGPSTGTLTNATAVGNLAQVTVSNSLVLGSINGVNGATADTKVGIGTTAPSEALHVTGNVRLSGALMPNNLPGTAGQVLTSAGAGLPPTWAAGGSGWGLTGNAGTVDGTNFIGTTDNIPFNIRVNNQKAGRIEGATPFGTFYGYQAGQNNGAAQANVAIGYQALTGVTSASNTAIGYQTLQNTNGGQNTAVGSSALTAASSGAGNTALGQAALANATTANFNTAVGLLAMQFTTGGNNAALGSNAGQFNSSGQTNVFVGFQAGFPNATVANSNTSGSNNTFIGPNTGLGSSTQRTNATAIGANAAVNADNSLVLGSINGVNGATTTVNVGIGTSAPTNRLHINEPSAAGNFLRITNNPSPNGLTIGLSGAGSQEAFIANNENAAMYFQTNAANRMAIDATGNIGINKSAPTEKLDVAGNVRFSGALLPNNLPGTSGQVLTSAGAGLPPTWTTPGGGGLINNTGTRNLFAGSTVPTTGTDNAFFGELAANSNTTGSYNVIMGTQASQLKTTGDLNVIIGWKAGRAGTVHQGNTLVGANAGEFTDNGSSLNSFFGERAGYKNTTGAGNTFIGDRAGAVFPDAGTFGNTTGSDNTAVGDFATMEFGGLTNATALGTRAMVSASNSLVLGSINGVNGATASTNVGIGTTTPSQKLEIRDGVVLIKHTTGNATLVLEKPTGAGISNQINFNEAATQRWSLGGGYIGAGGANDFSLYNYGLSKNIFTVLNSSGWMGIGTTSPSSVLSLDATASNYVRFDEAGTIRGLVGVASFANDLAIGAADNDMVLRGLTNLILATNSTERVRIDINGNVGIGTSTPNAPMQFANTLGNRKLVLYDASNNDHQYYGFGVNGGEFRYQIANNSGAAHKFYAGTSTTTSLLQMSIGAAGNVAITGSLSKGSGTFKIDHPQDPENKYLYHSFVESPEMMNVYNGNISTDEDGNAIVELPTYFESLNKDFRYQLTVIGTFAQAIVMKEIEGNQFVIKTDKPNVKVSWQVTGVRKDPFAEKNRVVPEVEKPASEKGRYLHPEAYGLPLDRSVNHEPKKENN